MDRIRKYGFKVFTSFLVGMATGGLIGILGMTILISYRLDQFYEEIAELKSVIEEKDERLNKLEESTNKQRFILKEVKVELIFEGDEIDEIELKKHIRNKYITLIGKEVKSIDTDLLEVVIDRRMMELGKNRYQLFIRKVILTDVLEIWINVETIQ